MIFFSILHIPYHVFAYPLRRLFEPPGVFLPLVYRKYLWYFSQFTCLLRMCYEDVFMCAVQEVFISALLLVSLVSVATTAHAGEVLVM